MSIPCRAYWNKKTNEAKCHNWYFASFVFSRGWKVIRDWGHNVSSPQLLKKTTASSLVYSQGFTTSHQRHYHSQVFPMRHSLQRADFLPKCYGAYAALNDVIVYLVNAIGWYRRIVLFNGKGFSCANGSWYFTAFAAPSCCIFS